MTTYYAQFDRIKLTQNAIEDDEVATKSQTETLINKKYNELVDGAPLALDTLKELADALNNDENAYSSLQKLINDGDNVLKVRVDSNDEKISELEKRVNELQKRIIELENKDVYYVKEVIFNNWKLSEDIIFDRFLFSHKTDTSTWEQAIPFYPL